MSCAKKSDSSDSSDSNGNQISTTASEQEASNVVLFKFSFPTTGEWAPFDLGADTEAMGLKTNLTNGSTTIATVTQGLINDVYDAAVTHQQTLETYQSKMEEDAKTPGRVTDIENKFEIVQYNGADCLSYEQNSIDHPTSGPMNTKSFGRICIHPTRKNIVISMWISSRRPVGTPVSSEFETQKNEFLDSLEF